MQTNSNKKLELIWFDQSLVGNLSEQTRQCLNELKDVINPIHSFIEEHHFLDFISKYRHRHFILLASGSLGQKVVPKIHSYGQIESILIFCGNVERNRAWAKSWPKICEVSDKIKPIRDFLNRVVQQNDNNAMEFSMICRTMKNNESIDGDDDYHPSFIYTNILKEIIFSLNYTKRDQDRFVQHAKSKCRKNPQDLEKIAEFDESYDDQNPIYSYTRNGLVYPMVNQALRDMDITTIAHMGFFIRSLHKQIQTLYSQQCAQQRLSHRIVVYRGQAISKSDFENLRQNSNGFIWFNTFLSTSLKESVALSFAKNALGKTDSISVVYEMDIDASRNSVPFALIKDKSYFRDEEEILFSMHTRFRIEKVAEMAGHPEIWKIHLRLTEQLDEKMRQNLDFLRRESAPDAVGWLRLAFFCMKFKEYRQAKVIYQMVLDEQPRDKQREHIFHNLGLINMEMNNNEEALRLITEAINIETRLGGRNSSELLKLYNNRAVIYQRNKDFPEALAEQEKILQRRRETLPPDDLDFAASFHSFGSIYFDLNQHKKALKYFLAELEIYKKHSFICTPELDQNYQSITLTYLQLGEYVEAEKFAQLCLEVREKIFANNRISIGETFQTLAEINEKLGKFDQAKTFYEKALRNLPSQHENRVQICKALGAMARHKKDYQQAISYYKDAMKIEQKLFGKGHENLYDVYRELSSLFKRIGDQNEAKSYSRKAEGVR